MSQTTTPTPPKRIRGSHVTQRLLQQKLWRPANVKDDWGVFVVVGREGSGKSLTCASILESVDPSFSAERTHFQAAPFLRQIEETDNQAGTAIMLDESGNSMGNRTWYDQAQILFNQAMQTARDDNLIIGTTLPRLEELDIQFQGRLHAIVEMTDIEKDEWAEFKWFNVSPSRKGEDKLYTYHPRMRVNGTRRRVTRFRIGPPSEEYIAEYQPKKSEWKSKNYDDTISELEDDGEADGGKADIQDIANEIKENGAVEQYIATHNGNGTRYLDADLIQVNSEYDLSGPDSKKIKKVLEADPEVEI